jgi:protein O-GlcNAc transferase
LTGDEENLLQQALDHHLAGRMAEARRLYESFLQALPDQADALYFLGVLAHQSGQHEESVELMRRCLAIVPDQARCYTALGLGLMVLGRMEETEASFLRAIELDPTADRYENLGCFLKQRGRFGDAIQAYREAAALAPDSRAVVEQIAELHCDQGDALQARARFQDALAAYEQALAINPNLARAWYAAGCAESSRKEYAAAIACFTKALEIRPHWPETQHNLGHVLFKLGQVDEALTLFRKAAASGQRELPETAIAVVIPGSPLSDNAAILDARRTWAAFLPPQTNPSPRPARTAARPLRVGYISSFFQDHNWMKPVWGLINRHDRRRMQVHLFSDSPASEIRYGYRAQPGDRFHDVSTLSNDSLSEEIKRAEIDVLVDLNGYSCIRRLPLFALRPAPVVVGWFNMYATTGMTGFDYLIGDDVVIPPDEEKYYCEKIVRVPGSYLTFEVSYPVPEVIAAPCRAGGAVTFGCLASQYKITTEVINAWSRILAQVANSSLIVRNSALASPRTRNFVHELFERCGISSARVHLHGPVDHFRFLETYAQIDIALDTFPYNGGTTTMEAIWQGVPVVTFFGDRWASRTSASILQAAHLTELIGESVDAYLALAVRLANSPDYLCDIRQTMRPRLCNAPVCDTASFARNMEHIYYALS